MKKQFTITYIICIHLLLVVVLLKSNFIQRVEKKLGFTQRIRPEITEHYNRMVSYQSRMDGNMPDGAVVFIGDSITQGLSVSAVVPVSVNFGISSDTTVGVLKRLPMYRSLNRASTVVFAIGVNDIKFRPNEEILRNYSKIVAQMPKNIPVIFSAVLPRDADIRDEWPDKNNDRIKTLNADLEAFTLKSENLFFVDAGPLLVDKQGNLADKFHDGGGAHLDTKGYEIWISELQKIIERVQQSPALGKE